MIFDSLAVRGIDISGYNGAIDWAKVKASSHFVIIRAGYGNTTDKTFITNWEKASVPKAAYWYMDYYSNWYNQGSKAYGLSDAAWGAKQARNCWNLLKNNPGNGIVWLDIESGGADYSPNITSSPAAGHAQGIAKAFLIEMDSLNGRKNGIYCSVGLLTWFDKWFRDRPLWVAWYTKTQTVDSVLKAVRARNWEGKTMMWQYASDGDIDEDGKGDGKKLGSSYDWLDLNVWVGGTAEWNNFVAGTADLDDNPPKAEEGSGMYKVRVNAGITMLLIRSLPSTTGAKLGYASGEYSVYEEKNGYGRIGTGRWISLDPRYVEKVTVTPAPEDGVELTMGEKVDILWDWYKESK